ncbi:hypothetical protein [Enterovibrio norvegicus]|uniref:Uncharacterized protein n=1 Tax=Enterovibrio norvegicus TaxID=188144 RepID=A0ABV4L4B5_9GAMM|nr:hypothetical protein [Enterovibrio norvegicus]OEF55566.1 hypothetical protein A1OU_24735 [Enterovibrio norvegicus]
MQTMLTVPVTLRKKACINLWSAPNMDVESFHYHVDGDGEEIVGLADRYGVLGSGRAAIFSGGFVKGIGPTPLVNEERHFYSTGSLIITDAVMEVIYLEAIDRLVDNAIKPLMLSLTDVMEEINLESAIDAGYDLDDVPLDRKIDHGALLGREIPTRIAHIYPLELNRQEIIEYLVSHNPDIADDKYCFVIQKFLIKVANILAVLFINRFSVGTTAISNFSIHGVPFDTASSSFLRDFRNCWIASGKIPVWEENKVILNDLTSYTVDFLGIYDVDDIDGSVEMIDETYEKIDQIWEDALHRVSLLMLGLTLEEIDCFEKEAVLPIQKAIIGYLQEGTIDYDLYDGDIADWRAPKWVGLHFDEELPALVAERKQTSFAPLNEAFSDFNFTFTDEHVERCKMITASRLPLTNVPTLELKLRNLRNVDGNIDFEGYRSVIDEAFLYMDEIFPKDENKN